MNDIQPVTQTKLFGLDKYLKELIDLFNKEKLPNKILLSGQKGLGKSTLAFHLINYVLSKNEDFPYKISEFEINEENPSFKTVVNKSNPNLISINISSEKKFIDINQIRELIITLNKHSLNNKPRFVLIDNIEFLNINSINALLKILEEPSFNVYFILINNNKKILSTLTSRCLNFKISITYNESLKIVDQLLGCKLNEVINEDLVNYYFTPGNFFYLLKFAKTNNYDLKSLNLTSFLRIVIQNSHYKKDNSIKFLIYDFLEFYFRKFDTVSSINLFEKYNYFLKKISDTKKFNLDEESLFLEFEEKMLNG